jgi:hypothetical protein
MPEQTEDYRLYGDLAEWWPLISPTEEYTEEAGFAAALFGLADGPVREVLEPEVTVRADAGRPVGGHARGVPAAQPGLPAHPG